MTETATPQPNYPSTDQTNNTNSQVAPNEALVTPKASSSKPKTALKILLILILWILFSYIFYGSLFGDASTPGGKFIIGPNPQSEAGWGLVFGLIIFPPIITLIGTITTTIFCLKSGKRLLIFAASIVTLTALVIIFTMTRSSIVVNSIPSKVGFEVYKPATNNPFRDLHQSYFPVDEAVKSECRGVTFSFYGSENPLDNPPFKLNEMKADSYNCPEFEYFNRELYDQAEKAVATGGTYYIDYIVSKKLVGSQSVLIVRLKDGTTLHSILSIKNNTLINISTINSNCPSGSTCEQKYLDFYKSLHI